MLKMALLTGSLIATLAGTYVLGQQEPLETATTVSINHNQPAMVLTSADGPTTMQLPPDGRGVQIQLQPIPQAVQPKINPVARTRSSR
jgi:hypothetical protein